MFKLISSSESAETKPFNPLVLIKEIKPIANSTGVLNAKESYRIVAIQLKHFTTVGSAMIISTALKYAQVLTSKLTVNV